MHILDFYRLNNEFLELQAWQIKKRSREFDLALLWLTIHLETENLLKITKVRRVKCNLDGLMTPWHNNTLCWIESKAWPKDAWVGNHTAVEKKISFV